MVRIQYSTFWKSPSPREKEKLCISYISNILNIYFANGIQSNSLKHSHVEVNQSRGTFSPNYDACGWLFIASGNMIFYWPGCWWDITVEARKFQPFQYSANGNFDAGPAQWERSPFVRRRIMNNVLQFVGCFPFSRWTNQ